MQYCVDALIQYYKKIFYYDIILAITIKKNLPVEFNSFEFAKVE